MTDFSCDGRPAGNYANPDDPHTYYTCVDGHPDPYLHPCPPGLVFNPATDSCDYPQ